MSFTPIRLAKIRQLDNAKWWPQLGEIGIPGPSLLEVCRVGSHSEEQDFVKFNIRILCDPAMPLQVCAPERSAYMSSGPCTRCWLPFCLWQSGSISVGGKAQVAEALSAILCPTQKGWRQCAQGNLNKAFKHNMHPESRTQ